MRRRAGGGAVPGGERPHRGPEAGHSPGPALSEGLLDELALRGGVDPPERTLAGLLLGPGHFDEVAVQGQVVADRVLDERREIFDVAARDCFY